MREGKGREGNVPSKLPPHASACPGEAGNTRKMATWGDALEWVFLDLFLGFRAPILQKVESWMAGLGLGLGLGGEGQEKRFT